MNWTQHTHLLTAAGAPEDALLVLLLLLESSDGVLDGLLAAGVFCMEGLLKQKALNLMLYQPLL